MSRIDTTIRQWCAHCGRATVSQTCCTGHSPETWCTGCRIDCPACAAPPEPSWNEI